MLELISSEELVIVQKPYELCIAMRKQINTGKPAALTISDYGVRKRTAEAGLQIVLPNALMARVLYIKQNAKLAGNPEGRKFYYLLRWHYYWPALDVDDYTTVPSLPTCARNHIKFRRNTTERTLFTASEPLESVFINILGDIIGTSRGKHLVHIRPLHKVGKTFP